MSTDWSLTGGASGSWKEETIAEETIQAEWGYPNVIQGTSEASLHESKCFLLCIGMYCTTWSHTATFCCSSEAFSSPFFFFRSICQKIGPMKRVSDWSAGGRGYESRQSLPTIHVWHYWYSGRDNWFGIVGLQDIYAIFNELHSFN